MRRCLLSLGLIALLIVASTVHVVYLNHLTGTLSQQLTQAQEAMDKEDWEQAEALTKQAWTDWEGKAFYLHITLHHADIDQISISFQEALSVLELREQPGEYAAANARIIQQLYLLSEAELPSIKNLL